MYEEDFEERIDPSEYYTEKVKDWLVVEHFPNKDILEFHFRGRKILPMNLSIFKDHDSYQKEKLEKMTILGKAALMQLREISGIVGVGAKDYSFWIEKGVAFSWSELQPKIIKIITKYNVIEL